MAPSGSDQQLEPTKTAQTNGHLPHLVSPNASGHRGARFLAEWIRRPTQVGAIAPSSRALARMMLDRVDIPAARVVVEYGPGTGAFTDAIRPRLGPGATLFGIELNAHMAAVLAQRHPGVRIHRRSVDEVESVCREEGLPGQGCVDVIVSGLPWASFPDDLQVRTLEATRRVLRPGGALVTFGYHIGLMLPAGRRFYRRLPEYFPSITRSRTVWGNLPPAFVFTCRTAGGE